MRQPELVFITGLMKSGKSEQLIKQIDRTVDECRSRLILKPAIDSRDGDKVKSRALMQFYDAVMVDLNNHQLCKLILQGIEHYEAVFIDEVQFMDDMFLRQVADRCYTYGVDLVVAGLTYDFKGNMFPSAKYLHAHADRVIELNSACDCCGSKADRDILVSNGQVITEGNSVAIEGSVNEFFTICDTCLNELFIEPNKGKALID